jgi:hypothetical protein
VKTLLLRELAWSGLKFSLSLWLISKISWSGLPNEAKFFALALYLIYVGFQIKQAWNSQNEKAAKERQELESKYAAQDAELLEQFNKHHG